MIKDLGVMINCGSSTNKTVKELKVFISDLKKIGYTYIMLYFEDTIELDGEPYFGYMRGRYSKSELKEIDAFCRSIDIECIPSIETLGHLVRMFKWSHYDYINNSTSGNPDSILLIGEEKTYELIEKMVATCAECFTSRRINVGLDEAETMYLGNYYLKNGVVDKFDLFNMHVTRISEICAKYNFKPYMWSDMYFKYSYGQYYSQNPVIPQKVINSFPKDKMNLIYWDYFEDSSYYEPMLDKHLEFNCDVWFAGSACNWIGYATSNFFSLRNTRMAIESCNKKGITNYFSTLWGGTYCSDYCVLPTLVYTAECAKGNYSIDNAKERFFELFGENWDDFLLFDLLMPENVKVTDDISGGGIHALYCDTFCSKYDSTVTDEGYEAKAFADYVPKFEQAKNRSKRFGYLFDKHAKYCKVLSLKYSIGVETRKLYKAGDKEGLKKLIIKYDALISALEEFHKAVTVAYFKEMKGHCFDMLDIQDGAVIQRVKTCKNRILDYINNKIEAIDELDEEIIDYYNGGKKFDKRMPLEYQYFSIMSSVNIF